MIQLAMPTEGFDYEAGDVLMIQSQNHPALVSAFLTRIGLAKETMLTITADPAATGQVSSASLIKFPTVPISAHELFSYWLNLSEPPTRHFCGVVGQFLEKAPGRMMQSQKMQHFASKTADGKSDYFSFCIREKRNILEVFADFGVTKQVPLAYLIQGIGR